MKTKVSIRGPKTNDFVNALVRHGRRCCIVLDWRTEKRCNKTFESVVKIDGSRVDIIPVCAEHRRKYVGPTKTEKQADAAAREALQEKITYE